MFRRRTTIEPPAAESTEPTAEAKGGGKGRPTPKRRDAEQARKARVSAPRDRKEALRQQREKSRAERLKVQQAMATGDERYLPARDKGPIRRFVRDFIDARRTPAEYLLPYFLVLFFAMTINVPLIRTVGTLMWILAIVIVPIDLIFLARRLKKELRERFPNESHRGAVSYGVMRATQIRRLRLPKPQVKPGQTI
ncbi:DUF3043 domain-containing protein [Actinopolymorpha alba]|uniref:DUF3043 domain-containing protein n=1 Tax=Actinopolymorpha alba TaxID=533267 RepID=UPI0003606107|nr:DUF3043 domain-containing protein [Actinopolymorpha alba]